MKQFLLIAVMIGAVFSSQAQCPLPSVGSASQYVDTAGALGIRIANHRCFAYAFGLTELRDSAGSGFYYDTACVLPHDGKKVIRPGTWLGCPTAKGGWVRATPFVKRIEPYIGTTDGNGNFTVTFATPFPVAPNVQPQISGGLVTQTARVTARSTTGFTINVQNRTDVVGLLPSYSNVSGATVMVLVMAQQ